MKIGEGKEYNRKGDWRRGKYIIEGHVSHLIWVFVCFEIESPGAVNIQLEPPLNS